MHTRCPVKYTVLSIPLMSYVAGILESVPGSLQHPTGPARCSMLACDTATPRGRDATTFLPTTPPKTQNGEAYSTPTTTVLSLFTYARQ
jgi:hypothetical protein